MGTGLKEGQMHESKEQQLYAADSGVEDAASWLIHGKPTDDSWDWTWDGSTGERDSYEINEMTVDVTVESLPEVSTYKVTSTATGPDGSTTILATLWTCAFLDGDQIFDNQNPPPQGDLNVAGNVTLEGNIEFAGTLTAAGTITSLNNVRITGTVGAGGDFIMENNSNMVGTLCVGGNITIGKGCQIHGVVRLQAEDATITITEAGAEAQANIWADGNLTIDIATNAPIAGDIYAPDGNIYIYLRAPNAEIQGDIYAAGTIQILVEKGTHTGTENPGYSGPPPFPEPECPTPPEERSDILSYEVT
jgi:cytoskeletal protein CcmA (bactofilin family)